MDVEACFENLKKCKDAASFFSESRRVMQQVTIALAEEMDRIAIQNDDANQRLIELRGAKSELQCMKAEILQLREQHSELCRKTMETLEKCIPNARETIEKIGRQQAELTCLRALSELEQSADKILDDTRPLRDDNDELIYDAAAVQNFIKVLELEDSIQAPTSCTSEKKRVQMKVDNLAVQALEYAIQGLSITLKKAEYPFDEAKQAAIMDDAKISAVIYGTVIMSAQKRLEKPDPSGTFMNLLLTPLKENFHYHFYRKCKTNNPLKPEWYFLLLRGWFESTTPFIHSVVHNVDCCEDIFKSQASTEWFITLLVQFANDKTTEILKNHVYDVETLDIKLFSHLIDEVLKFELFIRDFDVPIGVSALLPFYEDEISLKWALLERSLCAAVVDELFNSPKAFFQTSDKFNDGEKYDTFAVGKGAIAFVVLLDGVRDRSIIIRDTKTRARLSDVILYFALEFGLRLGQISSHLQGDDVEKFIKLMNTLWFMACNFRQWSDPIGSTPFLSSVSEAERNIRHLWEEMTTDIVETVATHLKPFVVRYQKQKWTRTFDASESATFEFSGILLTMRRYLSMCESFISQASQKTVAKDIIKVVAVALRDDVILRTTFSASGAQHMLSDISTYLIPHIRHVAKRTGNDTEEYEAVLSTVMNALRFLSLPQDEFDSITAQLSTVPDELLLSRLSDNDITLEPPFARHLVDHRLSPLSHNNFETPIVIGAFSIPSLQFD